jgi:hypothetical protein
VPLDCRVKTSGTVRSGSVLMPDQLSKQMIAADFAQRNAAMPPALVDLGARFLALAGSAARVLDAGCGAGRDMA